MAGRSSRWPDVRISGSNGSSPLAGQVSGGIASSSPDMAHGVGQYRGGVATSGEPGPEPELAASTKFHTGFCAADEALCCGREHGICCCRSAPVRRGEIAWEFDVGRLGGWIP